MRQKTWQTPSLPSSRQIDRGRKHHKNEPLHQDSASKTSGRVNWVITEAIELGYTWTNSAEKKVSKIQTWNPPFRLTQHGKPRLSKNQKALHQYVVTTLQGLTTKDVDERRMNELHWTLAEIISLDEWLYSRLSCWGSGWMKDESQLNMAPYRTSADQ